MRIIGCKIENEYVVATDQVAGAVGSHDDVFLFLHFNEMWEGLTKSVTWLDANGENPTITMLTVGMAQDDTGLKYLVPVPAEAKAVEGEMFMTIKGVSIEGQLEKSATLTVDHNFTVLPSRWDPDAEAAEDVTPTVAEIDEILGDVQDAIAAGETASDAAASASNSALSASASATAAQGALQSFMDADAVAQTLTSGSPATVSVSTVSGHKRFTFGIPRGEKGDKGDKGDPGSGGGDMLASIYDPAGGARQVMFADAVLDGGTWV